MATVGQVASELGISERRVRQRIAEGSLLAEKVGRDWVVQSRPSALPRRVGRPLAARTAWDVVAVSAKCDEGLPSRRRARARRCLEALRDRDELAIAATLSPRAQRLELVAADIDLRDLAVDPRIVTSGLSSPLFQMAQPTLVEAYVEAEAASPFISDFLLRPARGQGEGNVVLHVVPVAGVLDLATAPIVVACDLVEHGSPRDVQVAHELIHRVS